MKPQPVLIVIGLMVLETACASAQNAVRTFSLDTIREQCIAFTEVARGNGYTDCRVTRFGELGTVDGETYYYAIYCLLPPSSRSDGETCGDDAFRAQYHRARGLAVFARAGSETDVRLIFERVSGDIGMFVYREPVLAPSAAGTLLQLPIAYDGTGNFNASEYFVREGQRWERIDAASWLADLAKRLPPGVSLWKGVWPDLLTLRAEAGLYREGDGNCCPTGGLARIQLAVRDKRFILESVTIERNR